MADAVRTAPAPKLDMVGSVLSAAGLGLLVLGVLQSSTWGWVKPKEDSPVTPFGFSLTVFVIGFGMFLLWAFTSWQSHRDSVGGDPLVHLALLGRSLPGQQQDRWQEQPPTPGKGDRRLKAALGTAAMGAIRTKNSYAHALFRRVAARRGGKRAQAAVAHGLLVASWHLLSDHIRYQDLGGDYYIARDKPEHRRRRALRQLESLGYRVTLDPVVP